MAEKITKPAKVPKSHLSCPYCEKEIAEASFPYCEACKGELPRCPKCYSIVEKNAAKCLQCGASLKTK